MKITNCHYLNDAGRVMFLNEKLDAGIAEIPRFKELNELLNSYESNTIVLPMFNEKEEIDNIIDKGKLYKDISTILFKMKRSACHDNVEDFLLEYKNSSDLYQIINGFALSEDGLWRFHSWILKNNEEIIETTELRLMYFGFILR